MKRGFRWPKGSLGFVCATLAAFVAGCAGTPEGPDSEQTVVHGTLQAVVVRNADQVGSHFDYFIEDSHGTWTRLVFDLRPDLLEEQQGHEQLVLPDQHAHAGVPLTLSVSGVLDGDRLHVEELIAAHPSPGVRGVHEALIANTPRKTAVILANFANDTSQPITATVARELVFSGPQSANAYFKEMSFGIRSLVGKQAAAGDIYGWDTIALNSSSCDYAAWGSAARTAAQSAGVDLSGYDHVIHYFPATSTCLWSGVGQVPGRYTWINGSSAATIAHELGHNFGSHHAASITCRDANGARVPFSTSCTTSEYGNPFDVMGRGYRHMTAFNKGRTGFLEPENTVTASADGTFTIRPLETKSTGIQSLRIPVSASIAYYVEFRQPFGFDNFSATSSVVNGVLINRAPASYSTVSMPALIDMVPSTPSFSDAVLTVGRTFTDAGAGISITLNSVSSTGATVTVNMP